MRAWKRGTVVAVEDASYVARQGARVGERIAMLEVYLGSEDPKYAADRISGPPVANDGVTPIFSGVKVGDEVDVEVQFTARSGQRGPYLSTFAVGCNVVKSAAVKTA
jgi:hypothetical protein